MTTFRLSPAALVVVCAMAAACARNTAPATGPTQQGVTRIAHPGVSPFVRKVVQDSDRLEADQALDAGRHPDELLAFGRSHLAAYKAPKIVYLAREFPRTQNGKILRREITPQIAIARSAA